MISKTTTGRVLVLALIVSALPWNHARHVLRGWKYDSDEIDNIELFCRAGAHMTGNLLYLIEILEEIEHGRILRNP